MLGVEGEDARIDARYVRLLHPALNFSTDTRDRMIKDDREKAKPQRSLFAEQDTTGKIDQRQTR